MLRWPIGKERRQDGERDLDARIVDPTPQTQHHPSNPDSPENFAGDDRGECSHGLAERKYTDAYGADREAVENERSGVICQPFAFEDDDYSSGDLRTASDVKRRHGVRRRDNCAQYE